MGGIIRPFVFVSHTPYWFMRSYLFLFLLIPLIGNCINNMDVRKRWFLLTALFFMTTYMGLVKGLPMEYEGKGVINFIFLYIIGDTLRHYEKWWKSISIWKSFFYYLFLNVMIFIGIKYGNKNLSEIAFYLSYPYGSPIIILNAVLLFIVIGHFEIKSNVINWFAKSTLAIYLLHVHPVILSMIFIPFMRLAFDYTIHSYTMRIVLIFGATLIVMLGVVFVDKILKPVWNMIDRISYKANEHFDSSRFK